MKDLKMLEIEDRSTFQAFFAGDPPQASEYTFTNLFMWRKKFNPAWTVVEDCLLIIMNPPGESGYGLFPVGSGNKRKALDILIEILREFQEQARISRVESRMVEHLVDTTRFEIQVDRDNFDYVYRSEDLIQLKGNRYHRKKNHLNRFKKNWNFEFRGMDDVLIDEVLQLQEDWCEFRECVDNQDLFLEDQAVYEALKNYRILKFKGGVILIDGKVEAFSFGETLNPETAVIHVEKANPEIPGLYTAINQMFASESWSKVEYINREQDLGLEGLKKAKESYYPVHMVEKYVLKEKS
jgi:uncharacterized protein